MMTAFFGKTKSPLETLEMSVIYPAKTISQMQKPEQYNVVFPKIMSFVEAGCSAHEASALSDMFFAKTGDDLYLRSEENVQEIESQIHDYLDKGMKPKDLKLAESIIEENKELVITEWIKIYGK